MIGLFVDDVRGVPPELEYMDWDIARDYKEAIDMLENNYYDLVSLDHDLADFDEEGNELSNEEMSCKEYTGYDILCWIEMKLVAGFDICGDIRYHTANPAGATKMQIAIDSMRRKGLLK